MDSGTLEKQCARMQADAELQSAARPAAGHPLPQQMLAENRLLREELAQARTAIVHKDELIMEWIAAALAWKAVAIALREEGQAADDRQQHPLAHDAVRRNRIYREVRRTAHARLKAQLYPPTSWRPK